MILSFVLYNIGGLNTTTGIGRTSIAETPQDALFQNYPNPFNPSTRIEYVLHGQNTVTLKIYNILGQEVATLLDEEQSAGRHTIEWNSRSSAGLQVSSGVYFCRIEVRTPGGSPLSPV